MLNVQKGSRFVIDYTEVINILQDVSASIVVGYYGGNNITL